MIFWSWVLHNGERTHGPDASTFCLFYCIRLYNLRCICYTLERRASIKFSTTYLNLSFDSRKDWMLRILLISNWSLDWIRFNFLLNLFPLNWKMEPILPSFLPMGSNVCSNPKQPGGWHPRWPVPRLSSGCCAATARRQAALTDKTSCGGQALE